MRSVSNPTITIGVFREAVKTEDRHGHVDERRIILLLLEDDHDTIAASDPDQHILPVIRPDKWSIFSDD